MQLEDMVAEQDNAIAALREKLKLASTDSQQKQYKYEEALKKHESEKDRLLMCFIVLCMISTREYLMNNFCLSMVYLNYFF